MDIPRKNRKPAYEVLKTFLDEHNIQFVFRRQPVRYTDDNALLIEPPTVVAFYKDQIPDNGKEQNG